MPKPVAYAVVLAGGGGTRLWPASRRARPKQLLQLAGSESLLAATVRRITPSLSGMSLRSIVAFSMKLSTPMWNRPKANRLDRPVYHSRLASTLSARQGSRAGLPRVLAPVAPNTGGLVVVSMA